MPSNAVLNDQDVRSILTGADGRLFFSPADDIGLYDPDKAPQASSDASKGMFMAHVNAFSLQGHFTNMDFHPVGSKLILPVPVGKAYSMTLTETVIVGRDNVPGSAFEHLRRFIEEDCPLYFNFTGIVESICQYVPGVGGAPGTVQRQIYTWVSMVNCVPDGTVDLLSIRPGDFISRSWTLRTASKPLFKKSTDLLTF